MLEGLKYGVQGKLEMLEGMKSGVQSRMEMLGRGSYNAGKGVDPGTHPDPEGKASQPLGLALWGSAGCGSGWLEEQRGVHPVTAAAAASRSSCREWSSSYSRQSPLAWRVTQALKGSLTGAPLPSLP